MTYERLSEHLQALELASVAVTATIDEEGRLGSVVGLWPKLLAAAKESAALGILRCVVVSEDQQDVPAELLQPNAAPLRVLRAANLAQAVERLYQEHGAFAAVRAFECARSGELNVFGTRVPMQGHYQPLRVLCEVERSPLSLDPIPSRRQESEVASGEKESQKKLIYHYAVPVDRLFDHFTAMVEKAKSNVPRFVVLGPPGSGKTTLLQYLTLCAASGTLRVAGRPLTPVRMRLREWEDWSVRSPIPDGSLPAYLAHSYRDVANAPDDDQWRMRLRRGDVLLLMDSLDEIKGAPSFITALEASLALFDSCPVILTGRMFSFEQPRATYCGLPVLTLADLDDNDRSAYIAAYPARHPDRFDRVALIKQLRSWRNTWAMLANPLLLATICFVMDNPHQVSLPATRGQLFDEAVKVLLARRRTDLADKSMPEIRQQRILEIAALSLFARSRQEGALVFGQGRLLDALTAGTQAEGFSSTAEVADRLLDDLMHNSGLLQGSSEQGYFFLHAMLHEFLASAALARRINEQGWHSQVELDGVSFVVEHLIDRQAPEPYWHEVILLLAGQLLDPVPLLRLLADKRKDDHARHRLALAALSLVEISSELLSDCSDLVDRIVSSVGELWWRHVTKGDQATIPHIANVLPAIGRVNGRWNGEPVLDRLANLLDGPPDVHLAALKTIEWMGSPAASPEILDRLEACLDTDDTYAAAYDALKIVIADTSLDSLGRLARLLCHGSMRQTRLVMALVQAQRLAAVPQIQDALVALLRDYRIEKRIVAAAFIATTDDVTWNPQIVSKLQSMRMPEIRDVVVDCWDYREFFIKKADIRSLLWKERELELLQSAAVMATMALAHIGVSVDWWGEIYAKGWFFDDALLRFWQQGGAFHLAYIPTWTVGLVDILMSLLASPHVDVRNEVLRSLRKLDREKSGQVIDMLAARLTDPGFLPGWETDAAESVRSAGKEAIEVLRAQAAAEEHLPRSEQHESLAKVEVKLTVADRLIAWLRRLLKPAPWTVSGAPLSPRELEYFKAVREADEKERNRWLQ